MDAKNLAVIRQSFAQAVFTHKVQESAADACEFKAAIVKIVNILLAILSLVSLAASNFYPDQNWLFVGGTLIGIAEIAFLIFQLFFNFEQRAVAHKNSALKYLGLRDSYRLLITDVISGTIQDAALTSKRDSLQHQYQVICDLAPQTCGKSYTKAQQKLNKRGAVNGEEFTWSDKEIDRFLPEELRLKK
jgi:hypothetical protein